MASETSWGVRVFVNGEDVLTIEQGEFEGVLAGIPDIEKHADIVRMAAAHLMSFIGKGGDHPCFMCGEIEDCDCWSEDSLSPLATQQGSDT